jgi:16S rRNA (uracil1498-N3)-methyltransferase
VPDLGASGSVRLASEEAHYVARVCRARQGDLLDATDGRGALARLRLTSVGRDCDAEVIAVERRERTRRAWLWCGAPERGRADWMVEKLAELGVERFQPLECDAAPWPAGAARGERWQRLAVAALRQSRRVFLMEILPPVGIEQAIATMERPAICRVGDPDGLPAHGGGPSARAAALEIGAIGPSGGFSAEERARLGAAGFAPTRLADARLRTETAAVSLAAWWAVGAGAPPQGGGG